MKFTKMQGCGNDYVYVNGFAENIPAVEKPALVRRISDRHFGIGSDGVIFINPTEEADFEMEMYNADGSRSEMCGNGIRCVGKYVYDKGLTDKTELTVVSAGQIKYLHLTVEQGSVSLVRVNMGAPILNPEEVPVMPPDKEKKEQIVGETIGIPETGEAFAVTCVSMGNPHAVVFMENVKNLEIEKIGPLFENHVWFPNRTNTEFVRIIDEKNVEMRVWERGTGETLACGTGCCATVVACVLNGLTEEDVTVHVLGGEIEVFWNRKENLVYMTGPAETVFEGEIEI